MRLCHYSGNLFEPGVLKLRLVMKTLKGQQELQNLQASRNFNYHISVLILTSDDDNYFIQNELMMSLCRGKQRDRIIHE